MKIIISIIGHQDPALGSTVDGVERNGPIISILNKYTFDACHLICFDGYQDEAREVEETLGKRFKKLNTTVHKLGACNLRNVDDVRSALHQFAASAKCFDLSNNIFLNVSSGTPESITASLVFAQENPLVTGTLRVDYPSEATEPPSISEWLITREGDSENPGSLFKVAEPEELFLDEIMADIGLIGDHPSFRRALNVAETRAKKSPFILIEGELGVEKSLYAKLLYKLSDRRHDAYQTFDCQAASNTEKELFGKTKSETSYGGLFAKADGSTLFLQNIDALTPEAQKRLLDYIDADEDARSEARFPDVKLILSSNRFLREEVARGEFREDLYKLLVGNCVTLPSLAERTSDIPCLAQHALDRVNASLAKPKRFSKAALPYLEECPWHGNLDELNATIKQVALHSNKATIDVADFEPKSHKKANKETLQLNKPTPELYEGFSIEAYLSEIRRNIFDKALEDVGGNQSKAARLLGVTPQAVHKYIRLRRDRSVY